LLQCKTKTANFRLFAANGKWKFVFLRQQTIAVSAKVRIFGLVDIETSLDKLV
jgi:hypothetical protein